MSRTKLLARRTPNKPSTLYKAIRTASPSVYWPMQEASGNIVDVIAGKNGVPTGGPTYGEAAPWGKAIRFSGGQYFEIAHDALFDLANTFTMTVWFKLAVASTQIVLFTRTGTTPTNTGWVLRHESNNKMRMFKSQVGTPDGLSTNTISDTTNWHMLAGIAPAGSAAPQLYIDGVAETVTGPVSGQYVTTTNTSVELIGADRDWEAGTNDKFNGWIAHVALFPRVLSAGEIATQFAAGRV